MKNIKIYKLIIIPLIILSFSCSPKKDKIKESKNIAYTNLVEGSTLELTGELICAHCYALNNENTGINHTLPESGFVKDCAAKCARQNYPIALLLKQPVDSSKVWVIRFTGSKFANYMTRTAVIKGEYVYRGLFDPTEIKIKNGDDWININIPKPGKMNM